MVIGGLASLGPLFAVAAASRCQIIALGGSTTNFENYAPVVYLLDINKRVATSLGIDVPIQSELYKMLIYEEGAMFKPHTDTEKIPGMFGTLVICLPSAHTGGEVVVRHHGQSKTLKTSDANQSFACWFSDVTHEVLPVKSGYRCVLTYNLALQPGITRPLASTLATKKELLRKTLKIWHRDLASGINVEDDHLYYPLKHEYTQASISLQALKAEDLVRVQAAQELTHELPFVIFLALLEREAWGWVYYEEGDDECVDEIHQLDKALELKDTVKSLHALDGTVIAENYHLYRDQSLEYDPFEDLEVAKEDYEPYMGNEGPHATHWYRRAALVMVPYGSQVRAYPPKGAFDRALQKNYIPPALSYLGQMCSLPSVQTPLLDALSNLCRQESTDHLPPAIMADILKAALQHTHYALFKTVAGRHHGKLPASFFDWAKEWLNKLSDADRTEKYQSWCVEVPVYD
ncbi:hypothetical protein PTTG_26693 [Puccinia triticina 1-1 BBBD Race 1]|uniref:Fe2OG dioxygenase domain-containing protein n=1 Tax=Puccinia triticina (isolate 1-1 / race 1 (BBBD)) TaxID=630390 RepID=A0A180GRE3_PUCT1|nr:hypothetical protein PTTG_26693 [Puccinia triticina 1-1 BBBD Race 1]